MKCGIVARREPHSQISYHVKKKKKKKKGRKKKSHP